MAIVAKIWVRCSWPKDARILEFLIFWNSRFFLPVQQAQTSLFRSNLLLKKLCFFRSLIISGRLFHFTKRNKKNPCHRLQIKKNKIFWRLFEQYEKWWDICRTNEKQEKDSMFAECIRTLSDAKGFTNIMPNIINQIAKPKVSTWCKIKQHHS